MVFDRFRHGRLAEPPMRSARYGYFMKAVRAALNKDTSTEKRAVRRPFCSGGVSECLMALTRGKAFGLDYESS